MKWLGMQWWTSEGQLCMFHVDGELDCGDWAPCPFWLMGIRVMDIRESRHAREKHWRGVPCRNTKESTVDSFRARFGAHLVEWEVLHVTAHWVPWFSCTILSSSRMRGVRKGIRLLITMLSVHDLRFEVFIRDTNVRQALTTFAECRACCTCGCKTLFI